MTNVNSNPPSQEMTESADPPTMKNAGRLSSDYGYYDFASLLAIVAMLAILVGAMVMAVMASHRRHAAGAVIYAVTGLGSLAAMALATVAAGNGDVSMEYLYVGAPLAIGWLILGAIAFVVGSVVRPRSKRHDASAF